MSNPYLPPEILDYIVDTLRDRPKTLRNCCLVTKSWIPRARKHLFAEIEFFSVEHLESWKKTFPDPFNSPAYHTHTLLVYCPHAVTATDAEDGGWIQAFSRLVHLKVGDSIRRPNCREVSLAPLHRFSPVLKSLRVSSLRLSDSQILDLVYHLPLLEDLSLTIPGAQTSDPNVGGSPNATQPSTLPPFTGTLELTLLQEMNHIALSRMRMVSVNYLPEYAYF